MGLTEAEAKAYGESYEVVTEELVSTGSGIEQGRNVIRLLYDHGSRRNFELFGDRARFYRDRQPSLFLPLYKHTDGVVSKYFDDSSLSN